MVNRDLSSRRRYRAYRRDFAEHRTEGSSRTAQAHAKQRTKSKRGQRSALDLVTSFMGLLYGHRWVIAIALALLTIATGLKLIPLYGIKLTVDNVLAGDPVPDILTNWYMPTDRRTLLATVAIGVVLISAVSIIIGMTSRYLATRTTKIVQARIRKQAFDHAVRLPLHRIQKIKSGGVASVLREDAGGIAELIFSMIYNPWRAVIQLIGSLAIITLIDWRLLLGAILFLPVVFITHRTWISRIRPLWRDIRATRQLTDSHATESFGGIRVVRTFGRQIAESARFTRNNHLMARQEITAWWWSRATDIAWAILLPLASALLLWYGGSRVLNDAELVEAGKLARSEAMTAGDLMMFLGYLGMLLDPIATLATSATAFQNSLAGLDRVLDLFEEPLETEQAPNAIVLQPEHVHGQIAMHHVCFAYPNAPDEIVLTDINLDVQPGQTVAFVGPSGAGKTTLCNLVARFYDPVEGRVELDGIDLRDIDIDSFRRLLGIVEQDIFLFDGTVAQNIGYGRRNASEHDIVEAAQLANAHEFISEFDHGYDTIIGERGVRLSGGQRQRIAIARAILADPRILILDEATSSLDTRSERLIQASLNQLLEGRTSFVIAHRISTIRHADQILVVDHGRIVEQGTHDELMAASGQYRMMVRMQVGDAEAVA